MQTLRAMALLGEGIALLPDFPDADEPGLLKVLPEVATAPTTVFFVYPSQRFVPEAVRRFIDLAVAEAR
jgi:DNA-binding transcriptional LysR family regulator